MMERLFKAKKKTSGEWVEGYIAKAKWYLDEKEMFVILPTDLCIYPHCEFSEWIEVDKTTICQYTGLTDKNGNKIWENDVLRGHGNPKDLAKVVFGKFHVIEVESLETIDGVVGWHTEVIPTDAISKCEPFCLPMPLTDFYIDFSEFEAIGNIFDNPELLQEDKQ